jgi:hypothetical protein
MHAAKSPDRIRAHHAFMSRAKRSWAKRARTGTPAQLVFLFIV